MKRAVSLEIENNLAALRHKRGFSAAWLAKTAGISRQTIYAMEAGSFVPNTAVALRLARALEVSVEDLFTLPGESPAPELRSEHAVILPGSDPPQPGQPVQLCRIDKLLIASPPSPVPWYLPASDAIVTGEPVDGRKTKVQVYHSDSDFRNRILVAGCDPGISVLARHAQLAGVELVLAHRNSSQALSLLQQGRVHIAGTHLHDEVTGESNIPGDHPHVPQKGGGSDFVRRVGGRCSHGQSQSERNPRNRRSFRHDVCMVNREQGAGSRFLLDSHLERLKIDSQEGGRYGNLAFGTSARSMAGANGCCRLLYSNTRRSAPVWPWFYTSGQRALRPGYTPPAPRPALSPSLVGYPQPIQLSSRAGEYWGLRHQDSGPTNALEPITSGLWSPILSSVLVN